MTLEETAKYIGKSTLYKMAREGKIPAVKIANQLIGGSLWQK